MVILEIFEGELVPISLDLDHLKSLKRTNFIPPLNSYEIWLRDRIIQYFDKVLGALFQG